MRKECPMRKIVLSMKLMATLVAVLALPLSALAESITHTVTYDYSKLTIGTDTLGGVTYSTVSYDGLVNGGVPGAPSLPVDYIRFSVPYNATNFTVNATTHYEVMVNIAQLVYPCQILRPMNDTTSWQITPPNSTYYSSGLYPAQRAQVVDEGFLAGENHIVTVAVMPIAFRRQFNGMFWRNQIAEPASISIVLTYQLSGTPTTSVLVRKDTVLRNEGFELTRSMVVNPDWVRENAVPDTSAYVHYHDDINPGSGYTVDTTATYLIVTTEELKHSTRRIAALKRQKGYSVKVVTMDEVLVSPYSGDGDMVLDENGNYQVAYGDDAGKLREYLKYCFYNLGTKYVLLAGSDVPWRYANNLVYPYNNNIEFDAPSDLYYSDLTGKWFNHSIDSIDTYPELYVGRILSKVESQIDNYTDKLFRYELNPGNGDYSYLKHAFFLKGRDFNDQESNEIISRLSIYFPEQSFIYDDTISYPSGKDVIDTLRINHYGLFIPFNHGDTTRIMVFGNPKQDDSYNHFIYSWHKDSLGDGLNSLKNKNYPMIIYAPDCTTVPYDNKKGISFGESFITGKDYGGPAYIGYARQAVKVKVYYLLKDLIKFLPEYDFKLTIANAFSKNKYRDYFPSYGFDIKEYINEAILNAYLGDPTIELWTDTPTCYSNINTIRSDNSISISGIDIDSTIVSYCANNGIFGADTISTSSVTLNGISPNSTIMLYKHNQMPYIAPLILQNAALVNSQYVIASDVTAGCNVDCFRTRGDVIIKTGAEYEIEASGTVSLEDGFKVEKGAVFTVVPSNF